MSAQDTVTKNAIHTIRMYWDSFEDDIGYAREIYWGISDLPRLDMFQVDTSTSCTTGLNNSSRIARTSGIGRSQLGNFI